MSILKIFWRVIVFVAFLSGIIGIVGIFADIGQWGKVMSFLEPYMTTLLFQFLSVALIVLLIVEATLKHQHKISYLNSDFMPMLRNAWDRTAKQENKERFITHKKSKQPEPTPEQDFNYFVALKKTGANATYTRLRDLYRRGRKLHDELGYELEHIFEHEDNPPGDEADKWLYDVYHELNSSIPTEAFKFCPDENLYMEKYAEFGGYLEKLKTIIIGISNHNQNMIVVQPDIGSKHDVWLLDAIYYLASGEWGNIIELVNDDIEVASQNVIDRVSAAWKDIPQLAYDGDLVIWGRTGTSGILVEISRGYWKEHDVDWYSIMKGDCEGLKTEETSRTGGSIYGTLKTSKEKVEKIYGNRKLS